MTPKVSTLTPEQHEAHRKSEYYRKHQAKYIAKAKRRRKEIREWLQELKATLSCIKCGEAHPACLDLHHRDPKTKSFQLGGGGFDGYSKKKILEEIAKCDPLCANCHRKHHYSEGTGPWANVPN